MKVSNPQEKRGKVPVNSIIKDFVKPFPKFGTGGVNNLERNFNAMAKLIGPMQRPANIQFRINKGRSVSKWCLNLSPKTVDVIKRGIENPNLEIITSDKVFVEIVTGKQSLFDAYLGGELRVCGDIELARIFSRRIHKAKI